VDINVEGDVNIGGNNRRGPGNRQPWQHNPSHRHGVNYRDPKTRRTYANAPGARPSLDRKAALGYKSDTLGSGGGTRVGARPAAPTKIGGGAPGKVSTAPKVAGAKSAPRAAAKPTVAKKPAPSAVTQKRSIGAIGSAGGNRPTAIGGLGGGAATRAASARGASSRPSSGSAKRGGGSGGTGLGGKRR
jgi:hypothetical protein